MTADIISPKEMNPQLFKQALEMAGMPICIRDTSLRPIFANKAFLELYEYTNEDIRQMSMLQILHKDTYTLYQDIIIPTLAKGASWEGEYVIRTNSGRLVTVWGNFDPVIDDNGEITHISSSMRDVSGSKRLRNALTLTERHLQFLSENTSDCLFRLRLSDGRYDYISSAVGSITGYSPQEFYDTPRLFEEISPNDWRETLQLWWDEFQAGESRYEYESPLNHKDGSRRWVNQRITVVKDDLQNPIAIEGIITDVTERKRAEEDLATARNSLNFISNCTSDIFFKMSIPEGRYEYISPSVYQFSGYPSEQFMQNNMLIKQFIHPEWRGYLEECWLEHLEGRVRPEYEFQFIHKSGEVRWARQRLVMHLDKDGNPESVEGIVSDVTEAKNALVALETSEEKFRFLAENITDVIWVMDDEYNFTYATPSVEGMWGYTPEELVHVEFFNLCTTSALMVFREAQIVRARAESQGNKDHINRLEMEHIRKDGQHIWVETTVRRIYNADGKSLGYQGVSRDITERKLSEDARRSSEQKYRLLVENISDVVWTQNNKSKFTYITPSAEALWGYSPDELMNMDYRVLFTPESEKRVVEINKKRRRAEDEGIYDTSDRVEFEHLRKDGTTVWAESVVRRTFTEEGDPSGYLGVTRDITERKVTEVALTESEDRFRTLFEDSPISLWEEDLTRLKAYFDELKAQGVEDFRTYFYENPEALFKCSTLVDVVAVNKATLDLLRAKDQADLLGNLDKVLTDSSMAAFTEEMILLASGGCEYCGEITHRTLDGDIIWVVVHFLVPPRYQASLSRVIVSLIDVTPRKRAEQALMESEERYRAVVENAQEGVIVIRDSEAMFINEAVSDILGYSPEELRQLNPLDVIADEDKALASAQFSEFLNKGRKESFSTLRLTTCQGEQKWATLNLKPIMWGGEEAFMHIITDITPYKELEGELRRAHGEMEDRVRRRTTELYDANVLLTAEIDERQKAQEHIQSLTQQLIRIQEDERQRISRDLHDKVAQDLSSIVLNIETLFDGHSVIEPEVLKRGKSVAEVVRGTIAAVRDISYELRPPALDQLGLPRAIERHCEDAARRTGVDIDFSEVGIENTILDFDTEINVYRMVQEALNNMGKHAHATKASVRMIKSHPDLIVRITDNGDGFDVGQRLSEAANERRMGLKSMEERARIIGGSMEIDSILGTGTRIIFKIPITDARRQ